MAANLRALIESPRSVAVQETRLAIDAVGRYVCSTWDEATANGGAPFDAVVVGSGMYGGYCAAKLWRFGALKQMRVLVLEAGPYLVSEHVQNLANIGFNVPSALDPAHDPGISRELVWGIGWRGNVPFPGLAYCFGGKSLYWGGWCPELTPDDLALWPNAVAQGLVQHYPAVSAETGVSETTDFITGALNAELSRAFAAQTGAVTHIIAQGGNAGVHDAPLAVQGAQPGSGLFSFDKFSSAPLLTEAVREDVGASGADDARRRLFAVTRAHVTRLMAQNGRVAELEVFTPEGRKTLGVSGRCAVILAGSAIESTRLALLSFPTPLMGGNLMAHMRTDFAVRIRRNAFQSLPAHLQTAALLIRGATAHGRFHVQVTAAANQGRGSDDLLFRMVPDLDLLGSLAANDDPQWVAITLRGVAEMRSDRNAPSRHAGERWIDLSRENDEYGVPRAWVNLAVSQADFGLWQDMDRAMLELVRRVAQSAGNIEYGYDGGWQQAPYPLDRPFPAWHQSLGETYHESGTLWMGDDPATSVTDTRGRFHHVQNAYCCDQAIFPTVGSVNPVLMGLALSRRLAVHLVDAH